MGRRVPRQRGRITRLMEPDMHVRLVELTRGGADTAIAAGAVGISQRAFSNWITRGRIEDEHQADGAPPDADEAPYHRLYREVMLARSLAGVRGIANIQKAAAGGFITEESVSTAPDGTVTRTTKKAPPDWRAAAWGLERTFPERYGKNATQVEIIGSPAAGAGQDAELADDLAGDLAARLAAAVGAHHAALTAAPHRDGAEDVVDAEVIADPET